MVVSLLMALTLGGPFPDRGLFVRRLGELREGDPAANVRKLLGPPDDILTEKDPDIKPDAPVWCYGTNGHGTFPTLGVVRMSAGKVSFQFSYRFKAPPPKAVIVEGELRALLRKLHVPDDHRLPADDPLWLIRAGNAMIAAGKDKSIAAIQEYEQVAEYQSGLRLLWLLRIIFDVPADPGYFPRAKVGAYDVPADRVHSPRHPLILVDDVPLSIFTGALHLGPPARVSDELEFYRANCRIRTLPLIPPNDPFETYQKILKSPLWPFPPFDPNAKTRFAVPYAEEEGWLLRSLLYLVRTAYRTKEMGTYSHGYINGLDFPRYHREFLATGARWDIDREMYLPADGKALLDDTRTFMPTRWKPMVGNVELEVILRRSDTASVDYSINLTVKSGTANGYFLVVRDGDTGRPINLGSPIDEAGVLRKKDLAVNGRKGEGNHSLGSGFACPEGRAVVLELYYGPEKLFRRTFRP